MKNKFSTFVLILSILFPTIIYGVDGDLEILLNNVYDNYDIPETSQSVRNLPWRNDPEFLKTKEENKTHILMAGFCAVLNNPLPGEEYNVKLAAKKIKGQIVNSSEIFSQNLSIGPYTKSNGFKDGASFSDGNIVMTEGGGVCKIASSLYNLAVLSNLEIVERYNHSMPVNYVPYGQDATVAYGIKDFKFKNTGDGPLLIWSKMIGNRLYIGFYGNSNPPSVVWNHEVTSTVEAPVKYIKNENLKAGEMITIVNGMDGATVKSTITITQPDGSFAIKNMGISHYSPLSRIIEIN